MLSHDAIRASLSRRGVGSAIIERVARLNLSPVEGERLRGIHYKDHDDPRLWGDCATKGDVIRRFGREVFDRIPRSEYRKRGRRIYVGRQAVLRAK